MEKVVVTVEDGQVWVSSSPMDSIRLVGLLGVAQAQAASKGADRIILDDLSPVEAKDVLDGRSTASGGAVVPLQVRSA